MRKWSFPVSIVLIFALLFSTVPARASIPTGTEVVLIFVAVAAVGAGIGIVIYHVTHKASSVTGCVSSNASGLSLLNDSDQKAFMLIGDTAGLKVGERVRLAGKKRAQGSGGASFLVEKMGRDFGACRVSP